MEMGKARLTRARQRLGIHERHHQDFPGQGVHRDADHQPLRVELGKKSRTLLALGLGNLGTGIGHFRYIPQIRHGQMVVAR